jgi:hypothetical protein
MNYVFTLLNVAPNINMQVSKSCLWHQQLGTECAYGVVTWNLYLWQVVVLHNVFFIIIIFMNVIMLGC